MISDVPDYATYHFGVYLENFKISQAKHTIEIWSLPIKRTCTQVSCGEYTETIDAQCFGSEKFRMSTRRGTN